ncbi:MAG: tetratricopeptide repeat protein [Magnetococcales bacterium]|nr:tetratricopeptide repeat protein [Magnetococcales bacterium]
MIPSRSLAALLRRVRPLLFLALLLAWTPDARAFYTVMNYAAEEFGKRDVLSFQLPPGEPRPQLALTGDKSLRITITGLLALPFVGDFDPKKTRFLESVKVEEIPGGKMGIYLNITLKEPFLDFRDNLSKEGLFRLEFERYPVALAVGPTRLLEGRVLAGRDATLLLLSYTGHGWVRKSVDFGARVVRLEWQGSSLDQGWREVAPEGLVDKFHAQAFQGSQVEAEIGLDPAASDVHFYRSSEAGTLVVEIRAAHQIGRQQEAEEIIRRRQESLQKGHPEPLNRLTPVFVNGPNKVILNKVAVDEAYYWDTAKEAEKDYHFAKALGYLSGLLEVFPDTANRELIELYRVELASKMNWQPSWALAKLEEAMVRQPNNHRYPLFRLQQLKLLNRVKQFENAMAIMNDPNLPKNSPEVQIERGRALLGLQQWEKAQDLLHGVFPLDTANGDFSAEANYLLARLEADRGDPEKAAAALRKLSRDHWHRLSNHPDWLLDVGEIFYENRSYEEALHRFAIFLNNYPKDPELAPRAMLRAAESNRRLKRNDAALDLLNHLLLEYPDSDQAIWAKIHRLQMDEAKELEPRLKELWSIIHSSSFNDAVVEAYITVASLQGDSGSHRESIQTLNTLLTLTSRQSVVERVHILKHHYMVEGMKSALKEDRPEFAVALAEAFGADWRKESAFTDARILLAEALMRMGIYDRAVDLVKGVDVSPAPEMLKLGKMLAVGSPLGVEAHRKDLFPEEARIRLNAASRQAERQEWEAVLVLLERMPDDLLDDEGQAHRLRLLAKAEEGRGRFPEAVGNLENLLFNRPVGEGMDYFWYASLLQSWKGDDKSTEAFAQVAEGAENPEIKALAHMRLGDILQRKNKLDEAQKHYQEAKLLYPRSAWSKVSEEIAQQLEMVK